jgi:hypothetical protein
MDRKSVAKEFQLFLEKYPPVRFKTCFPLKTRQLIIGAFEVFGRFYSTVSGGG